MDIEIAEKNSALGSFWRESAEEERMEYNHRAQTDPEILSKSKS